MSKIIREVQDLRHLDWAEKRSSSGTAGSLLKATDGDCYYKMSSYDYYNGIIGRESVTELIVCRVLDILGVAHLDYDLVHALLRHNGTEFTTWITVSRNFRRPGEQKMALDIAYALETEGQVVKQSPLEFCVSKGWGAFIYSMFVVDYLVLNRDRHGANIEILSDGEQKRLAPLFDHGLSLLAATPDDPTQIAAFDPALDRPVNNFIGQRSTLMNMDFIPAGEWPTVNPLSLDLLEGVFSGIDEIISPEYQEKAKSMLWERWISLNEIRNQR